MDQLFDGRRPRALTLIDNYSKECLAIDIGQNLHGFPRVIKTDNGSEFISKAMDKWAYENGVEIDFSRPGKPTDNAQCESFNGRFRQECLNSHWFLSFADAKQKIDAW